jgi:GTPase
MSVKLDPATQLPQDSEPIGKTTNFYSNIAVAAVTLETPLEEGDEIFFIPKDGEGWKSTRVQSIEIDRTKVTNAKPGDEVGIHIGVPISKHEKIYRKIREATKEGCCCGHN